MEIQTQIQVHQAIEYIKQDPKFPFDTHDDPEDILKHYGIELELDQEGEKLLRKEISRITADWQTAEVITIIQDDREAALLMR